MNCQSRSLTSANSRKRKPTTWYLLVVAWVFSSLVQPILVWAGPPTCDPPNVNPYCAMDNFVGSPPRQVPEGWQPFVLSGDLEYVLETGDTPPWGPPCLRMWSSGGTFKAGIWARVEGLTPGMAYTASVAWGAPNAPDLFGRQLGIDATGGTDPNSAAIIWGPTHWGPGRMLNYPPPDVNIDVTAVAQGSALTIFFLVDHPQSSGDNLIFVDAISLKPASVQPTPLPPTAVPPTPVPQPTAAPTRAPQPTDAPTATAAPTATPTETPTATPTFTPSPTATATETPTPTTTPTLKHYPTATPIPTPDQSGMTITVTRSGMLTTGVSALGGAGALGLLALWATRRRK